MKNLFKCSVILFLLSQLIFYSCQKADDSYKKFVVPGGLTYPGKASLPKVYSGRNRVKISWLRGTDPSVVKARIFWNNYTDSISLNIPPTGDTVTTFIDSLPEAQYTFEIITYNKNGDKSIPSEAFGVSYGDIYQASLLNRPISQVSVTDNNTADIQWGAANITGGAYASEVVYTDTLDNNVVKRIPVTENESTILGIKGGTPFQFRTVYLPDSLSIDTFYTAFDTYNDFLFDKSNWKVVAYSTEHDNSDANRVENIIDGNPGTRWHTNVFTSSYPHFVVVDMQKQRTISSFEIYRMTDDDRACDRFELAISNDNLNWQVLGDFNFNRLSNDGQIYPIATHPKARYFKFTGLSGPQTYMVMGEISVYGY